MNLSMRELIETLIALQEIDLEIRKLHKETEHWPAILTMRGKEVDSRKAEQEKIEEGRAQLRREVDLKELDIKSIEENIVKLNVTLNTVKTNKEYTAILNEIALRKSDISTLEEEILERMEKIDEQKKELETAKANVQSAQREKEKLEKQAEVEREEIREELGELEDRRKKHLGALPEDIFEQYERIAKSRDGLAVVGVVDGVCQGCFINLTAQEINLLMGAENIIHCRNCSRILYLQP
ncbi:MAG: zinc ribbon domain-containing protein [Planctomycetota bacterium]|jgi:predicted  nucleic acid-binding Zn-ribbon protein